jgi:hypothetical protein
MDALEHSGICQNGSFHGKLAEGHERTIMYGLIRKVRNKIWWYDVV